ncbi:hypothetical protein [Saccharopolyspora erythraea]|uniref:Uncharacterized protein n=2 Tax=Saccharopolyspora erythraea TaxID=1836 RepID=A4FK45_SACEN|nr:hypothetical protein [Saccharopolyspora erythraea]EQD87022.1 hypothetical protein N599_06730 [Saccharopolyspora erythraea D]QRK88173.1 hypothetical protein JQX30_26205 [Saccharopolyspora erythraea]CAM04420.1 hypothetical protein SACE_5176 [Saccharopolyspora erythraea NRRL 2338]
MATTAIQGAYGVTDTGELTGKYQINAFYRPPQQVTGMPLDTTVDLVLWRILNGYNPLGFLVDRLYRAELALYASHHGDQRLQVDRDAEGLPALTAFTGPRHLPDSWAHHHLVPGWTVFDAMANGPVFLNLNPGTPLSLKIMIRDLALLLTDRSRQGRTLGPIPFGE